MIRGINTDGTENTITLVIRKSSTLVMEESLQKNCPPGAEQKEISPLARRHVWNDKPRTDWDIITVHAGIGSLDR
jgi:hypothetical protein